MPMNRRHFLAAGSLTATGIGLGLTPASASATPLTDGHGARQHKEKHPRGTLDFKVLDLDFPVGSKNKTATLVTGEREALLVDTGFTRADGYRLVAEVLDSGKKLTTVFISAGDPDYYFGAEALADAFPDARFVATRPVIKHIRHTFESKLKTWADLGANLPTRLVEIKPLTHGLTLEGHRFELKGGSALLPDRHYLWQPEQRAILGGVLLFQQQHVWVADTPTPEIRAAWIKLLDEMAALNPKLVVPGHRLPGTPADSSAITATREYLLTFEEELAKAADGAALTAALVKRYPDYGMVIAAEIGAKVAMGEMTWE
ncbi:MBL fold metallo-hydrolase [Streptomyces sp. ADMS]|uniref:MBL fold metallo-hydrolase n=1 Tax=Streptomyces sp. ADMS TaxID=3071415 RepID=UPI00296FF10D|nr:MBL fold metallo-hydrolase [Streptomyces sp. ADMS]MDW4910875.1 MBL fold metallo-hydrolase [Streptomyces sp. ADMS]